MTDDKKYRFSNKMVFFKKLYHGKKAKRSKQVEKKKIVGWSNHMQSPSIFVKNAWRFFARFKESITKKGIWNQAIYTFIYCQNRNEILSRWHEELKIIASLSLLLSVCVPYLLVYCFFFVFFYIFLSRNSTLKFFAFSINNWQYVC